MEVKVKKLNEKVVLPKYALPGDAGMDLVATSRVTTENYIQYGTGLAIGIPEGYVGFIFPRSSITKKGLMLKNSIGVIDSGYRNEIFIRFQRLNSGESYNIGERIAQLIIMPYPKIEIVEVDELTNTERGLGGFGSTGKK